MISIRSKINYFLLRVYTSFKYNQDSLINKMITKPKFRELFDVQIVEPDNVFLLSETRSHTLNGNIYYQLSKLINGKLTVDDIAKKLQNNVSLAEIYYGLNLLENKGLIVESDATYSSNKAEAIFWNYLEVDPALAETKLRQAKVSILSFGDVDSESLTSILKSYNIEPCRQGDIYLVLTDDYLRKDLQDFNKFALAHNIPWMLIKAVGIISWIGPIFIPKKTGCLTCLSHRLNLHRQSEAFVQRQNNIEFPLKKSQAAISTSLNASINIAATEIIKWIVRGENLKLTGNIVTFNSLSLETQVHKLTKRPQCPCCGSPESYDSRKQQPLFLQSRKKHFTKDGGHRISSPQITLNRYQHHISPITGIVTKLTKSLNTKNEYAHAYSAGLNLAVVNESFNSLRQSLRSSSGGKGMSDTQARVSCLCESLERYSGVFQGDEPRIKSSYKGLGSKAIHPNACMNFSQEQYQKRDIWNKGLESAFNWIPAKFDDDLEVEWSPVWSLSNQVFKYLPTGYCYYNYPASHKEKAFYHTCSNGSAAGNSIEEAILQGFLELVERDSVGIWWYNRLKKPQVDLNSFDEPYLQSMQQYYCSIQRDLWVLDLTSDLNIPTFVAISRRIDKSPEDIILGFGCHFDSKIAILRAITELNQFLPAVSSISSDKDRNYGIDDKATIDWWKTATIANQPYLSPDNTVAIKLYSDYSQKKNDDLLDDVITCIDIARKNGMEILVLDQTRPDIELNVVKVIVPGMRHFWARFAPGRLYNVPVKLNFLKEPLKEEGLNPIPIFA